MKIQLEPKDIQAIANAVIEQLIPLLDNKQTNDGVLLTIREAAQYLGVKAHYLYQKVHSKEIPYKKAGHFLRFSKLELDEWIKPNKK